MANNIFLVEECAGKRCSECGTDGEVAAVACDCFHGPVSDFSECVSHHVVCKFESAGGIICPGLRIPGWFCVDAGAWTGHSTPRTEPKGQSKLESSHPSLSPG